MTSSCWGGTLKNRTAGATERPESIHVELGLQQPESKVAVADLRELTGELASEAAVATTCELVDDHPADVVPVARVLAARVAEADDEQVERRRGLLAALEEAHLVVRPVVVSRLSVASSKPGKDAGSVRT